jgi:hypothetical protein
MLQDALPDWLRGKTCCVHGNHLVLNPHDGKKPDRKSEPVAVI